MTAKQETTNKSSYLTDAISSLSPWSSRSQTPKNAQESVKEEEKVAAAGINVNKETDHTVSHTHKLSLSSYPKDCPRLAVQWFHAVDTPKKKPNEVPNQAQDDKPLPAPKKWSAFSAKDSRAIEAAFQELSEKEEQIAEDIRRESLSEDKDHTGTEKLSRGHTERRPKSGPNRTLSTLGKEDDPLAKVPVNEDYLFDVDIKNRELAPAYWVGPIYAVRRGTWFYVEGTTLKPCDETLAVQLEEGYVKCRPWKIMGPPEKPDSKPTESSETVAQSHDASAAVDQKSQTQTSSSITQPVEKAAQQQLLTHRLFGSHMNSIVTYQDTSTAWIMSDDFLSRMSGTMYQHFAGGAHYSGTKVLRGYTELSKKKGNKDSRKRTLTPTGVERKEIGAESRKRSEDLTGNESLPAHLSASLQEEGGSSSAPSDNEGEGIHEPRVRTLERKVSSMVTSEISEDIEKQDELARKRAEKEIRDDYKDMGEEQDREIDHLLLVTHGIGQRLGARFESFNFIHDVNQLRKTMKNVYKSSADLQALNSEVDNLSKNCRVQVLPIVWRRHLEFPLHGLRETRKDYDLGESWSEEDQRYPSFDDITLEGVPALRNILSDLALDILLYQTPAYKDHIALIVAKECNRIFKLFKQRNPTFKGKVSLVGHSLGSAIMFDLLSDQQKDQSLLESRSSNLPLHPEFNFDFEVEDFYCFGSPIGLFQMLQGKTITGRSNPNTVTLDGFSEGVEDPFQDTQYSTLPANIRTVAQRDAITSSPKCRQLYNVFHPTDPVSYRLEPLIAPDMAEMKPQPLPYTKKNFFGAPMGQGLTGIPAKVGQSFSGFWSNFSSGITNSLINKSLGISAEDVAKMGAPPSLQQQVQQVQQIKNAAPSSAGAGTNITSGGVLSDAAVENMVDDAKKRKLAQDAINADQAGQHPPTLIDSELETLYSGFQKRRKSRQDSDSSTRNFGQSPSTWQGVDERARRLKREEAKVRLLNSNGRVDYSIQEGAFDISFLASIASHLAYWTDEDVCHFIISQLLSRQRMTNKSEGIT